ncbi:ComEC/Rec2 family competence protein [Schlesneria sp. DSM 10557]|uniref:ComEC/Rec2 family competence protein n=1 Tax=Schlesneria sp. DSM 10557 TaxID=3044399 RepID=UPI0035A057D7
MSQIFELPDKPAESLERPRGPAIVIAVTASLGILADRAFPLPLDLWLGLTSACALCWLGLYRGRCRWPAVLMLVLSWFCLAAAWHHYRWNCRAENDIANSATNEPAVACVVGKIIQAPWIVHQPASNLTSWQNPDQTCFLLECRSLALNVTDSLTVSGTLRVSVQGAITTLELGDLLRMTGKLALPLEPSNPGDFDQRKFLQSQGVFSVFRTDHADGVEVVGRERTVWDWLLVFRGGLRTRAETLIATWLTPETAPVAQAMLLGSRVQIDEETRRAFRESGMLHVLAISGMNVGLLWSWLWSLSRWLGRSAATSTWIVLIALPVYAMVTDANPPIVRATVVAVIVAFGKLLGRSGSVGNSLALAGLSVLAWNPTDLFNTGAQLSFLAVFAILHAMQWLSLVRQQTEVFSEEAPLPKSYLTALGGKFLRAAIDATVVGFAVWGLTSPLIAREFHLVSPVGSLLTVLLVLPMTIMFWVGYSFLLLGVVWSSLFGWLGVIFDQFLRGFLWSVHTGARMDAGHVYVPSPPLWWLTGFYALTLLPLVVIKRSRWGPALSVRAGLSWIVIGLTWELVRPPERGVTCTFISVGHGLSVLIECPNGRTALYDAGSMVGGASVARTISQALWTTGRSRLDAVIVSHADGDHCNALPELSRIVSPGGLFVHRSFLDWSQPPVADAIEQSSRSGASVRLLSEGQSLVLDPTVSLNVIHPPRDFRSSQDNPNSLILSVEYAGRRILLTGDLELDGLERLLRSPPLHADVMLSPHHGSLKANPTDLARWATPDYLVISTPESGAADRLTQRYGPETQILTTARHGSIRFRITPEGELEVETFKQTRRHR